MKIETISLIIASSLFLGPCGWTDSSAASFLKIQPSARNFALGGDNPALSFGAQAVGANPANMVIQPKPFELTTTFASTIGGGAYGHLCGDWKDGSRAFGVHVTSLRSASLVGRDADGNVTSNFTGQDLSAGISYAEKLNSHLRVGITGKAVKETIGTYDSNVVPAADVGASLVMGKALVSAGVSNLGGKLIFAGGQGSKLPEHYDLGAAYELGDLMLVAGAGKWANEGTTYADMGLEFRLGPIALRAGYRGDTGKNLALSSQNTQNQALAGVTGGIGIKRENWRVDYAVGQSAAEYQWSQRVSLTVAWGGSSAAKKPTVSSGVRKSGKSWVR
jgi:hypothetical protein